jgi:hypothetical protein
MKVKAGQLRGLLEITEVGFVRTTEPLAIVDNSLG